MDWKIELIAIPVTDVDRARDFYARIGWSIDHDQVIDENLRFVQITPPGSACSIVVGIGTSDLEPGSLNNVQLVVGSADEALAHLQSVGVEARGVIDEPWGRFVFFQDPDGNEYALQEMPDWSALAQG